MVGLTSCGRVRPLSGVLSIAATLLLLIGMAGARPAHADGVTTCTNSGAINTSVMNCLNNLVFQPPPLASTTLVLVCPSGHVGLQDQSQCPGNVWRPLSTVAPTDLVGYCAQAQLTPYHICDYPTGKEGYLLDSTIFGSSGSTGSTVSPPPPSSPPPTSPPPASPPPPSGQVGGVTTCQKASAVNTSVMNCLDNLVFQPLPISSTTLVLICPSGHAGLQDQSQCPGNVWRPLSTVASTDLVGYCAQAQLTPYHACDYPTGKEGYRLDSDIFGSAGSGSTTPPAGQATGTAQLSWSKPAVDIDGNPITVTSYTIRYGTTDFSSSVSVAGGTTTYTISNLASGTWQFEITTEDSSGSSQPSNPVTLKIGS
jgi:hypothetical protein